WLASIQGEVWVYACGPFPRRNERHRRPESIRPLTLEHSAYLGQQRVRRSVSAPSHGTPIERNVGKQRTPDGSAGESSGGADDGVARVHLLAHSRTFADNGDGFDTLGSAVNLCDCRVEHDTSCP